MNNEFIPKYVKTFIVNFHLVSNNDIPNTLILPVIPIIIKTGTYIKSFTLTSANV